MNKDLLENNVEKCYNMPWVVININNQKALLTISTINVIYKTGIKDKTDIITPFVLKILYDSYKEGNNIGYKHIIEKLDSDFGLAKVPEAVIMRILRRLCRSENKNINIKEIINYNKISYQFININPSIIDNFDLKEKEANESLSKLTRSIKIYFSNENINITNEELKESIFVYMEKYGIEYILEGQYRIVNDKQNDINSYIISKYISDQIENNTIMVNNILDVFGGFLATYSIYYTFDDSQLKSPEFENLTLYIDAPLMLRILELKSPEENALASPIKELLPKNARLKCFEHTVNEIINIIVNYRDNRIDNKFTLEIFDEKKYDIEKIDLYIRKIESTIENYGIEIDKTDFDALTLEQTNFKGLFFDQSKLESHLANNIPTYNNKKRMLDSDVKSILYVGLMQKNIKNRDNNKRNFLFLTSNYPLSNAVKTFFKENIGLNLIVNDIELITAFWVNKTEYNNDLTKQLMYSYSSYIKTNLPPNFITAVQDEMAIMKDDKLIADETYEAFLYNSQFLKILRSESQGSRTKIQEKFFIATKKYDDTVGQKFNQQLVFENNELIDKQKELESENKKLHNEINKRNAKQNKLMKDAQEKIEQKGKKIYYILLMSWYLIIIAIFIFLSAILTIDFFDYMQNKPWIVSILLFVDIYAIIDLLFSKLNMVKKGIKRICNLYCKTKFKKLNKNDY